MKRERLPAVGSPMNASVVSLMTLQGGFSEAASSAANTREVATVVAIKTCSQHVFAAGGMEREELKIENRDGRKI